MRPFGSIDPLFHDASRRSDGSSAENRRPAVGDGVGVISGRGGAEAERQDFAIEAWPWIHLGRRDDGAVGFRLESGDWEHWASDEAAQRIVAYRCLEVIDSRVDDTVGDVVNGGSAEHHDGQRRQCRRRDDHVHVVDERTVGPQVVGVVPAIDFGEEAPGEGVRGRRVGGFVVEHGRSVVEEPEDPRRLRQDATEIERECRARVTADDDRLTRCGGSDRGCIVVEVTRSGLLPEISESVVVGFECCDGVIGGSAL